MSAEKSVKGKMGLTTKIFIGLIGGLILGIVLKLFIPSCFFRDTILLDGVFYFLGQGFINLMKMLVVPLVFFSLASGAAAIGDLGSLGKVGGKTLGLYLGTTVVAIVIALAVGGVIGPGKGLDLKTIEMKNVYVAPELSVAETLLDIIPDNPVGALAEGNMLQVIFFAILVGLLFAKLGDKVALVAKFCEQGNTLMMEMTNWVMAFAPIGVFCLIARTFAELGFDAFLPLLKYMAGVALCLAIQCFGVYGMMLSVLAKLDPRRFFKKFFPVMAFAFSTSTSNATIPMNIEYLRDKIGVPTKLSSFTVPLGATVNMDGTSIMQGMAVVFAAQAYGIQLDFIQYLTVIVTATLATIGTAGIPSVGLVTLSLVFLSVGLPVEAIGFIIGVDRILDMLRTAVNVTGDSIVATIVARQNGELDREVFMSDDAAIDA